MTIAIAAFYRFTPLSERAQMRMRIARRGCSLGIRGTLLLAPEGLNGTVAGPAERLEEFLDALRHDPAGDLLAGAPIKRSHCQDMPFRRLKVRLKPEIVTLRAPEGDRVEAGGVRVSATAWNELISRPDVLVVDVRNDYEVAIGSFTGAEDPRTTSFTEFKRYVDERLGHRRDAAIATFCTGGIRCEKATAYLKALGFRDVYQLEGGILGYLSSIPQSESLWRGACFVFDERVALDHQLKPSGHVLCRACGWPVDPNAEAVRCGCRAASDRAAAAPGRGAQDAEGAS